MPAVYVAPDGASVGTYAGWKRRAAAAAIDWTLCLVLYLLASIPAGIVQLADVAPAVALGQALAVGPVVGYFAYYLTTGSTLGMRATSIEMVVAATASPPGWPRALARALVAFVGGAAVYALLYVTTSFEEPLGGYDRIDRIAIWAAVAVTGVVLVSKLWLVVDRRASLHDRLFGLVVVEDLAPTAPDPSPWSGLWERAP